MSHFALSVIQCCLVYGAAVLALTVDYVCRQGKQIEVQRGFVADQLLALVRNHRVPKDETWPLDAAKFLFVQGFCTVSTTKKLPTALKQYVRVPTVPLSPATQKLCLERCYSILFELSSMSPQDGDKTTEKVSCSV